jgi:hypothetical protein
VKIQEVLPRRSDLSTFLVHLTRDRGAQTAKKALKGILKDGWIRARTAYGHAVDPLTKLKHSTDSQKVVCFTETPLEYTYLLLEKIEKRKCQFGPYGIALTKRLGRDNGVNPVWYVDISPTGHDWLSNRINALVRAAVASKAFDASDISRLTPFIEQMGSGLSYTKEFWWEREWRHHGDFRLPHRLMVLSPEEDFDEIQAAIPKKPKWFEEPSFVDPRWGLEQIIARLAGFSAPEIDLL